MYKRTSIAGVLAALLLGPVFVPMSSIEGANETDSIRNPIIWQEGDSLIHVEGVRPGSEVLIIDRRGEVVQRFLAATGEIKFDKAIVPDDGYSMAVESERGNVIRCPWPWRQAHKDPLSKYSSVGQ